jgi:hypothetical protein
MNHRLCLQTFGRLSESDLQVVAGHGWGRGRVEHGDFDFVREQYLARGITPLWILRPGEESGVPEASMVEVGNENCAGCAPDWERMEPRDYAAWALRVWETLIERSCTVYVGAINNPSPSALAWLTEVLRHLPKHDQLRVSLHRYSDPDMDVTKPKRGHRTLAAEDAAILRAVDGRRWAITEAGLVDAWYTTGFWWWKQARLRKALDGHRWQAQRFLRLGADFYTVYQLHDGPTTAFIDQCGIMDRNGVVKETATLPLLIA